jgi:ABC-type Fe3+/spermidine/putrescine transport system ATPase subunit
MEHLVINKVNKSYGQNKVIRDLSLSVQKGELLSLLGESGSGKTTLLKLITGIEKVDSGTIYLQDIDISCEPIQKRNIGMVFQDYALFPHLTAIENIEFGPKMMGVSKAVRRKQAIELLERVQMGSLQHRYPHQLSGGQKQRVAMGRALAVNPEVLLLDEPFSSLDINLRMEMCDFIKGLQRDMHITTILVTHDREEAMRVSDRLVLIEKGVVIQVGKPEEVYYHPNSIRSARYLGDINILPDMTGTGLGELCFRPEAVEMFAESQEGAMEAIVQERIFTGVKVVYILQTGEHKIKAATIGFHNDFHIGQRVFIKIGTRGQVPCTEK